MAKRKRGDVSVAPDGPERYESVNVRKIENGYVVSHSCYDGKKHTSRETYHPEKPKVALGVSQSKSRSNSLMDVAGVKGGRSKT